nr:hypothetical protein [Pirellula sp. SH-Sr6A]
MRANTSEGHRRPPHRANEKITRQSASGQAFKIALETSAVTRKCRDSFDSLPPFRTANGLDTNSRSFTASPNIVFARLQCLETVAIAMGRTNIHRRHRSASAAVMLFNTFDAPKYSTNSRRVCL